MVYQLLRLFLILNLIIIIVIILVAVYVKLLSQLSMPQPQKIVHGIHNLLQLHMLFQLFVAKKMEWKIVDGTLFSLTMFEVQEITKCLIFIFMQL